MGVSGIQRFVFFISSGRTGTHFLHDFFARHPRCLSFHEPRPGFKRRGYQLIRRSPTVFEKLYFKSFRLARCAQSSADYYVEANNFLFSGCELIRSCFPGALIVHLIRDGRDVVRSYINAQKRYADPGETVLTPDHFQADPAQADWDRWNPIQRTAWFWDRCNAVIEKGGPDLTISFEELFRPPHEPLRRVLAEMPGLAFDDEEIPAAFARKVHSSGYAFVPKFPDWPAAWQDQFWEIAGPRMERYGYS